MKLISLPKSVLIAVCVMGIFGLLQAQQLAFPTAEGYGKFATGGRGGKVYEVTTLNASGTGSLGAAFGASEKRTVVFRVSGNIAGSFVVRNGDITVAGQTAPGDGICIKGRLAIAANNVIIRYIRVRTNATGDAIESKGNQNLIFDHVSCSWSTDEVMSIYKAKNLTIQHCLISEAASSDHRFGGIWGAQYGTYHHNCFAHNDNRTPRWAGKQNESNDYRNNVTYNWGYGGCYGAWEGDKINMVANYYKPGPASEDRAKIALPSAGGDWHVSKNIVEGSEEITQDNWKGLKSDKYTKKDEPWPAMPIREETAEEAYKTVLAQVGCSFPNRDALDKRIIEEIRTGTAKFGNKGLIDKPSDAGGWPELKSLPAPADSDHDGMPDDWETKNGLNPNDASDGSKTGKDGYTNLENYMNSLVAGHGSVAITTDNTEPGKSKLKCTLNYLNVFNSSHTIQYSVLSKSNVKLEVFTLSGKFVTTLLNKVKEPGDYSENIENAGLTNGLYIYKLTAGNQSITGKNIY